MTAPRIDRRRIPANDRVAALSLKGKVTAATYSAGQPRRVTQPVVDLMRAPDGPRDRQLLFGEAVTVFETHDGWSFLQADKDGYVGYVQQAQLGLIQTPTHTVSAPASHVYTAADFKSPELFGLSFSSPVQALSHSGKFTQIPEGFVPSVHLADRHSQQNDPAEVAQNFLGTPYLWGGNSRWGIDCSGLVQAVCLACNIACPGDSDMQEAELGSTLPDNAKLLRNDLLFWKGHVALVVNDKTLIHANASHMAVVFEDIKTAIARISEQGDGPVTSHKRLPHSGENA